MSHVPGSKEPTTSIDAAIREDSIRDNNDDDHSSSPSTSSAIPPPAVGYSLSFSPIQGLPDIPGGVAPWSLPHRHQPQIVSLSPSPGALAPVPRACSVPLVQAAAWEFREPSKQITSLADVRKFLEGFSGRVFLGFVVSLSEAIQGKKLSDDCHVSEMTSSILSVFGEMDAWIDAIPPKTVALRYGNPAFREWQQQLQDKGPSLMHRILPPTLQSATVELLPYFLDSFGNALRIDYGTGHEANFLAWLLCLARLGLLTPEDHQALVSRLFVKYLNLMRRLQTIYWLEPAGSHGVWGLDDYHFLPFIFGSSQLIGHQYMRPKSVLNDDILETFASEYLYLSSIAFIKKVKKGPFAEHSPLLNDISVVATWNKVNSGMLKMYRAEVLEKVPIMQHFLFGTLLPWQEEEVSLSKA